MKKIYIAFSCLAASVMTLNAQTTTYITTPQNITTSQLRAPNGLSSHAFFRAATLVQTSELTSIPVSTTLTAFGFTTTAGADVPVTGTITVYLENTTDATFLKSTTWSTAIAPMTMVYTGTITLPNSATTVDLNLTTPFAYTGNAMYVAYDFVSGGPYATVPVTYGANNSFSNSHYSASSASSAPTTLNLISAFRPSFRFGFANPFTNDISVDDVNSLGSLPFFFGAPHQVKATVRNSGSATATNLNVSLNIAGANSFSNSQMISTLAPGASTLVTFANWTPSAMGNNTITVSVPSDQNNVNNSMLFKQAVSCNVLGTAQTPTTYTGSVGYNTGSGLILARFQSPVTATVSGANIAISTNTASGGNMIYAALVDNSGTVLATSNTITIVPGMYGTLQNFTFTPGVAISAATDYHIGMAQTANASLGYFPLGTYSSAFIPANLYSTAALTGGTLTPLTSNLGIMGLETVFSATCVPTSVGQVFSKDNNVLVYPNPAGNVFYVNIGSRSDNASVSVINSIGQEVMESRLDANANEINVSALARGVYTVKVVNGKDVSVSKIVIER